MTEDAALAALGELIGGEPGFTSLAKDVARFLRDHPDVAAALGIGGPRVETSEGYEVSACSRWAPHPAHLHIRARRTLKCPGRWLND